MKKTSKKVQKAKKLQNALKNKDVMHFAICFLFLVALLVLQVLQNQKTGNTSVSIGDFIELDMLLSVVGAFFLTTLAEALSRKFVDIFEDVTKLTNDYDALVNMYAANTEMLLHRNAVDSYNTQGRKTGCKKMRSDLPGDTYRIPIGDVTQLYGRDVVVFDNPDKKYTLPEFCREHYAELMDAHDFSQTYNQITLRTDSVKEKEGKVHISFSRSTYYDALVSNRAIDFKVGALCVRDLYAPGPFLASLETSVLSNHMGFNGMVETADGKFVFVKRHKRVSIGKKTMQCSVAASLKAKYALNHEGRVTKEGIAKAIMLEIEDELALLHTEQYALGREYIFGDFSFDNNVLYFYRDLLEGGKPQLMFYAKINVPSQSIMKAYRKKSGKNNVIKDGDTIICIDKTELDKMYLAPDEMVIKNKRHAAIPSAVATVLMLKQAMQQGWIRTNVQEAFTISKKGCQMHNEDALYVDDRFVAVIDGVTSKAATPAKATMTGGRFAAQTICDLLAEMPEETQPEKMLQWLNNRLKQAIAQSVFAESDESPAASLMLYDARTKTVISYGDCQVFLKGKTYKQEKAEDIRMAKKRAAILQEALESGTPIAELRQNDIGRAAIQKHLLDYASQFANAPEGGFPVLGRGEIVAEYIVTYPVGDEEQVVLASDGYPVLKGTLAESEACLQEIITEDPLLMDQYQATKGVVAGNVSYDDRTYIRFTVQ